MGNQTIAEFLADLSVGLPQYEGALAAVPLIARVNGARRYATMAEARAKGVFEVTELTSGGSVPELLARNAGDVPVLLLDGEILVGARQDRMLNLTVLAGARCDTVIPVSCVEAGRWAYSSPQFEGSNRTIQTSLRAMKARHVSESLDMGMGAASDQMAVWEGIAARSADFSAQSRTGAESAMYAKMAPAVEATINEFTHQPGQVGVAFVAGDTVLGIDVFDNDAVCAGMLPRIGRGYVLESLGMRGVEGAPPAPRQAVQDFVDALRIAECSEHHAVGLGTDVRLRSAQAVGGALVWEDQVMHLCAFSAATTGDEATPDRRMRGRG